tara:strand:- start:438 stop:608 length:171 start_codon:yes stop_codon:yes gene_type:complete
MNEYNYTKKPVVKNTQYKSLTTHTTYNKEIDDKGNNTIPCTKKHKVMNIMLNNDTT